MPITARPEIAAFDAALPRLLKEGHASHFAVLKNTEVTNVSPTYEQALRWGYRRYGLDDFFVKQVLPPPMVEATPFPK